MNPGFRPWHFGFSEIPQWDDEDIDAIERLDVHGSRCRCRYCKDRQFWIEIENRNARTAKLEREAAAAEAKARHQRWFEEAQERRALKEGRACHWRSRQFEPVDIQGYSEFVRAVIEKAAERHGVRLLTEAEQLEYNEQRNAELRRAAKVRATEAGLEWWQSAGRWL